MATFVEEEATTSEVELEPGKLMVLHGLLKTELNGSVVEIIKRTVNGTDGTFRWTCSLLQGENNSPMNIKPSNLIFPPIPTDEIMQKCIALCEEGHKLYRKSYKNIEKGKKKIMAAITLVPQHGMAHSLLGEIAHFTKQPQPIILAHMRRAVANFIDTEKDQDRAFIDRFGYSGALGNLGLYDQEQHQLNLLIQSPYISRFPNCVNLCTSMIADSMDQQGKREEAMNMLLALKLSQPTLGSFRGANIDERVDRTLLQISFHYYKIGAAFEKQGNETSTSNNDNKVNKYEKAKEFYFKAREACPTDLATLDACMRIEAILNPNVIVQSLGNGLVGFLNIGDEPITFMTSSSDSNKARRML